MAVQLIRDLLKLDQTVGKDQKEALVEGEIRLPQNKPSINKILTIDGDVEVNEIKVVKDKILVDGLVKFKVLYNGSDEKQPIHSLEASTDFKEEIMIEGITEEMTGEVISSIEHIDYSLINDSSISVKTVLEIEGKVQSNNSIDIVKEVTGTEGLQVLKEKIIYNDIIGTNKSSTIIKEAFELDEDMPDILDILRVDTKAYERETKVVDDKVIVSGIVEASIMYFGDDEDDQIKYLSYEIPFTHFVEVSGAFKDMKCNIRINSNDVYYDTKEDINGDIRIIDIESMIKINAKVYEQLESEVTVDTYSTNKKFDVKKQDVDITENIDSKEVKESINHTIELEQQESIKNIFNLNAKPIVTDYRTVEGKIIIEGLLNVDVLYQSDNAKEILNSNQQIPFNSYVDIDEINENIVLEISNVLESINYKKTSSNKIEIDSVVKSFVSVNRIKKFSLVTEAEELDEILDQKSRPSITVYVVQKGDTLWDIAKKYNSTVEEIIEANDIISPENVMPGEKIIIEKNIEFKL